MPLNRLRQVLGQLDYPEHPGLDYPATPGYNPEAENPAPFDTRMSEYYGHIGRMAGQRSDDLDQAAQGYEDWVDERPETPAWRTAAAIGASMLRPLRQGGIPQMLATSPEQQRWESRGSLLQKRLEGELELEKERLKQSGELNKAAAQYGAAIDKPELTTDSLYDPRSGRFNMTVGKGELLAERGSESEPTRSVLYNPEPFMIDPGKRAIIGDQIIEGNPTSIEGTLIGAGEPRVAPGRQYQDDARLAGVNSTASATERWQKYAAEIRAGAARDVAATQADATKTVARIGSLRDYDIAKLEANSANYGAQTDAESRVKAAEIAAAGGVSEAALRGPTSSGGGSSSTLATTSRLALNEFNDETNKLRKQLLEGIDNDPERVQDAIGQLHNLFLAQKAAIEAAGGQVEDLDFSAEFNSVVDPDAWFDQVDETALLSGLTLASSRAIAALGQGARSRSAAAPAPAPTPAPTAQPTPAAAPAPAAGGLMSQQEFVADYTQEKGTAPTPEQVERARGVFWQ